MLRQASYANSRSAIAQLERCSMLVTLASQQHLVPSRPRSTWAVSSPSSATAPTPRYPQQTQTRGLVRSSLRQRRPQVNGESVAFHVNDLVNSNFTQSVLPPNGATSQQRPQPTRKFESDLIVMLDMDECLVHSQFLTSPSSAELYAHQVQQKILRRQQNPQHGKVDSFGFTLPDGGLVHVNIRPGLRAFLDQVTQKYETHVFTAALPAYADPVLDQLDPDRTRFAQRWYRGSCTFKQGAFVKNIATLPFGAGIDLDRVVLVDNSPMSFLANPSNGILVSSFYNDPRDNSLESVWKLLQELDEHRNVRPFLEEKFGLTQVLGRLSLV